MKEKLAAATLLLIMVLNFIDVQTDIKLGVPQWHIIEESIIVCLSGIMAGYLIWGIRRKNIHLRQLKKQLVESNTQLKNVTDEMKVARSQYSELIHNQFNIWGLTPSEKEIVMLLLKGLSFKELSAVREVKEKTIRQQASTIYSKAGVDGRHDLAAWFLEDLMLSGNELKSSTGKKSATS